MAKKTRLSFPATEIRNLRTTAIKYEHRDVSSQHLVTALAVIDSLLAEIHFLGSIADACTFSYTQRICEGCRCDRRESSPLDLVAEESVD
jgi:hypothetical protein